jgi:hypothetical protein
MRRTSIWLTALLLILAVSVTGLASMAAASGSQVTAAKKKKGCKKGYVKKKTKKGSKCAKKKKAAPRKGAGNAKLPADGQYRVGIAAVTIAGGQKTVSIRATIPKAQMQCASGTPSRSNGVVSIVLPIQADGSFSGSASNLSGPAEASGRFTSATQVTMTVTARDVQGGNTPTDLCNGTATISGTLSPGLY